MAGRRSYSDLLSAVWCPICGAELSVVERDGKKMLVCSKDGEMKSFLDQDPLAEVSVLEA